MPACFKLPVQEFEFPIVLKLSYDGKDDGPCSVFGSYSKLNPSEESFDLKYEDQKRLKKMVINFNESISYKKYIYLKMVANFNEVVHITIESGSG